MSGGVGFFFGRPDAARPLPDGPVRRSFVADTWSLARPYWVSEERWVARGLLAVVIGLTLASIYVSVLVNRWNAAFYNALQLLDAVEFFRQLGVFGVLTAANVACAVYQVYFSQMLQIRWRRWLTESFLAAWLGNQAYYRSAMRGAVLDNPDQRISEDLGLFVVYTLNMSLGVLSSAVTLVSFIAILWGLSGAFVVPLAWLGAVTIPGYMVWAALLYAVLGTWVALRVGEPLVRLNFDLQRHEADFRFSMARFQENAESIALTRGEASERARFRERFARILRTYWAIMRRQRRLTSVTWIYGQLALVFPILVAAPRYFAGEIMLGGLMQTAQAFTQVQSALSFIVNSYPDIARWRATVDRLIGFECAMRDSDAGTVDGGPLVVVRTEQPALRVEDVDLDLPNGEPLLRGVRFAVHPGASLLIAGPTGSGKTTLLRAIAGLWPFGRGRIEIPGDTHEVIMPEKPYLPTGTMRRALLYPQIERPLAADGDDGHWDRRLIGAAEQAGVPQTDREAPPDRNPGDGLPSDADLRRALDLCNLAHLAGRLDEEQNWAQRLSLSEQKCLAFARLLLQRPDIIFLDETTSGLDENTEARLYRVLRAELPQAMVITVGHRGPLPNLPEERLELRRHDPGRNSAH